MRRTLGIALAGLVLSGCAGDIWLKAGATQQDLAKDRNDCENGLRQSRDHATGRVWVPNAQGFEVRCMVAKGWALREET